MEIRARATSKRELQPSSRYSAHMLPVGVQNFGSSEEELVAQFVGHIIVRTKSIRDAFTASAQIMLNEVLERLDRGELNPFGRPDFEAEMRRRMIENPLLAKLAKQKPREFRARLQRR